MDANPTGLGSYNPSGLCRRDLSVIIRGLTHHLVAYIDIAALFSTTLRRPSTDSHLSDIVPRPELLNQASFTTPVEEDDRTRMLRVLGT